MENVGAMNDTPRVRHSVRLATTYGYAAVSGLRLRDVGVRFVEEPNEAAAGSMGGCITLRHTR
jgi:hypothetical protein